MWRSDKGLVTGSQLAVQEKSGLLDQWMMTGRSSCDQRRASPVHEVPRFATSRSSCDTIKTVEIDTSRPYSCTTPNFQQEPFPSPYKPKPFQVHSASPRCIREDINYPKAQTPTLRSIHTSTASTPNYMVATASAKARVRSHSAPRQRPLSPDRDRPSSAKKRLSFPVPDPSVEVEQRSNVSSCCHGRGHEVSSPSAAAGGVRRWLN